MRPYAGVIGAGVSVVVFAGLVAPLQSGGWSNKEIDDWFEKASGGSLQAYIEGDLECEEALDASAMGIHAVDSIIWNGNLGANGATMGGYRTGPQYIEINHGSDNVTRTIFHETLHAAGWGWEGVWPRRPLPSWANSAWTHGDIYRLAGTPGGALGRCVKEYLTH